MDRNEKDYQKCLQILREELLSAMGCTEPIAVAYAGALVRQTLGNTPQSVTLTCSGNIIKNVKSVVVPNTGGLRGLRIAAAAGIIAGHAEERLELLRGVTQEERHQLQAYAEETPIEVCLSQSGLCFDIFIEARCEKDYAAVRIAGHHTNVVLIQRNEEVLLKREVAADIEEDQDACAFLSVERILDFAKTVDLSDVADLLERQIQYNMAIAEEGLRGDYGANVGSVLLATDSTLRTRIKAMAAAGSDARMSGCEMPVVINSGSGNQGITVCVPLVVYAREKGHTEEELYRALVLANLITIHQRRGIGRLSAYCGAINAGIGTVCGIAFLHEGSFDSIAQTLINAVAIASGVICDGAKASCATKIIIGIEAGLIGYDMYRNSQAFHSGDGIVKENVETTIAAMARLGRRGMREVDKEILHIMIDE